MTLQKAEMTMPGGGTQQVEALIVNAATARVLIEGEPGSEPDSPNVNDMNRTIHYDIFGDLESGPIPPATRERILDVQTRMNREFTWTHDNLKLELYPLCHLTYPVRRPEPWAARLGGGASTIGADEWNAAVILRFLDWVSTQLSDKAFVRVRDEGVYLVAGDVTLRHGCSAFDQHGFDDRYGSLRETDPEAYDWSRYQAMRAELDGRRLAEFPAHPYRETHPEMERILGLVTEDEFNEFTLEDAANYTNFPWQEPAAAAA